MPACGLPGRDLRFRSSASQSQLAEDPAFHLCESLMFTQASRSVIYKQCIYMDAVRMKSLHTALFCIHVM